MTAMDPDGALDTWYMNRGDVYFIPRAYPHHIEVVDAPDLHFAIFFDQPTPGDIGYRASASAYSREVLAASFNVHIDDLPNFPFTKASSESEELPVTIGVSLPNPNVSNRSTQM